MAENSRSELDKLKTYSEKDIRSLNIPLDQMWLIRYQQQLRGPYYQQDLLKYAMAASKFYADLPSCNLRDKHWKPFFEHEAFDKRSHRNFDGLPEQQAMGRLKKLFYFLDHGKQEGPFTESEIHQKVKDKVIFLDSLLSDDHGETWKRFYKFEEFDRRNTSGADSSKIFTISAPEEEQFEKSAIYTKTVISHRKQRGDPDEALKQALLIGQQESQRKKKISLSRELDDYDDHAADMDLGHKKTLVIRGVLVGCLALIIASMLFEDSIDSKKSHKTQVDRQTSSSTNESPSRNSPSRSYRPNQVHTSPKDVELDNSELEKATQIDYDRGKNTYSAPSVRKVRPTPKTKELSSYDQAGYDPNDPYANLDDSYDDYENRYDDQDQPQRRNPAGNMSQNRAAMGAKSRGPRAPAHSDDYPSDLDYDDSMDGDYWDGAEYDDDAYLDDPSFDDF